MTENNLRKTYANPIMKNLLTLMILFTYSLTVFSEYTSEELYGQRVHKSRVSFFTNFGLSISNDLSSINNFLETNNYPKLSHVWNDINYVGVEIQYKRFVQKTNFIHSFNSNEKDDLVNENKTRLSMNGVSGMFGYQLIGNYRWSIIPSVGFEMNGANLELTEKIDDFIQLNDLIHSPNILKINKLNYLLKGEIGVRYHHLDDISYALYIGYKYGLNHTGWEYQGITFSQNPILKLDGLYANISIQYNIPLQ